MNEKEIESAQKAIIEITKEWKRIHLFCFKCNRFTWNRENPKDGWAYCEECFTRGNSE